MTKPKLLDLFCGAGGCSEGYRRAGFQPYGIDNDSKPLRHYPFPYICMDALEAMDKLLKGEGITFSNGETLYLKDFDAYHASPPCQAYSIARNNGSCKDAPRLIEPVRELLQRTGKPYAIENVYGAPLLSPIMLCGSNFGLGVSGFDLCRHRYFESNIMMMAPPCHHKRGFTIGVYGNGTNSYHRNKFGRCVTVDEMRVAMGIDWMVRKELTQAIPPAYIEYIGKYLIKAVAGI